MQGRKEFPVEAPIAGDEPGRLSLRVSANEKIGQDSRPGSALPAVRSPSAARQKESLPFQVFDTNLILVEESITFPLGGKVHTELRVYDVANHKHS